MARELNDRQGVYKTIANLAHVAGGVCLISNIVYYIPNHGVDYLKLHVGLYAILSVSMFGWFIVMPLTLICGDPKDYPNDTLGLVKLQDEMIKKVWPFAFLCGFIVLSVYPWLYIR